MIKANGNDRKGRKVGQAKVGRCGRLPRSGLVQPLQIYDKNVWLAIIESGKRDVLGFSPVPAVILQGNLCFDNPCFETQISNRDLYSLFLVLKRDGVCYLYRGLSNLQKLSRNRITNNREVS